MSRKLPNFRFEKEALRKGYDIIIGVDEVGRGAFAGPVVAAAVAIVGAGSVISSRAWPLGLRTLVHIGSSVRNPAYPRAAKNYPRHRHLEEFDWLGIGIDDSKRLRPRKREALAKTIREYALGYGIGEIGVAKINKVGIARATAIAMRIAVKKVRDSSTNARNYVLVDAFHIKYIPGVGLSNQKAIIKGDQKSISIAAASIIAKVHRDKLMLRLARRQRKYGWGRNKGYGTAEHQKAIKKYGLTRWHRKQFVNNVIS